ncbi:MAG TPA: DegT/DnrJ/EryC1/StrS family aminotransferase, partial [Verrucomicrobiae bacterium]|nr:DegT/DnrJ/EryC1/StrS family aminotransferase [Verrucomicrobiae bacterium]
MITTNSKQAQVIPFFRPSIEQAEIDEVVDTLKNGWLTTGPKTKQFEADFATYVRQKHAIALNSCTAALHLALEAIGLQSGESVIVPTVTFAATAEVVRYFNAKPILVDCRTSDFNLDPIDAEARIVSALDRGEKVRAILPVHYGGQMGDIPAILRLAARFGLQIIEDAAHCCPAYYRSDAESPWKPVGADAAVSCYSFYANKAITTGEGGMACTENDSYAERMRIMSLHGISRDAWKRFSAEGSWYYEIVAPGFKYNLTDIAAAIGLHQVRKAGRLHRQRTKWAAYYTEHLRGVDELILPRQEPNRIHSWHLYAVRLQLDRLKIDRAQFITELKQRGISTSVHWMPLHMHPYYRETYGCRASDLPHAATVYPELVTLPLYPDLTE